MAKDLTKELLATIKETLPETQVGLIKEALVERDELKAANKELQAQAETDAENYAKLAKKNLQFSDDINKLNIANELYKRERDNIKTENDTLKTKDVERRAAEAEAELRGVQTTQQLFLRNTIVRENIQHQVVDETPATISEFNNGYSTQKVVGVNKVHRGVTDVKQTGTASEDGVTVVPPAQ